MANVSSDDDSDAANLAHATTLVSQRQGLSSLICHNFTTNSAGPFQGSDAQFRICQCSRSSSCGLSPTGRRVLFTKFGTVRCGPDARTDRRNGQPLAWLPCCMPAM